MHLNVELALGAPFVILNVFALNFTNDYICNLQCPTLNIYTVTIEYRIVVSLDF